jgi:hypothetical protein
MFHYDYIMKKKLLLCLAFIAILVPISVLLLAESEESDSEKNARYYPNYTWRGESEEVRINYFQEHDNKLEANMSFTCETKHGHCKISVLPPGKTGPRVISKKGDKTYIFAFLYAQGIPYEPKWLLIPKGKSVTFKWFFEYFDCNFLPVNIYETPSKNQDWYWEDVEWDCFEPPAS